MQTGSTVLLHNAELATASDVNAFVLRRSKIGIGYSAFFCILSVPGVAFLRYPKNRFY